MARKKKANGVASPESKGATTAAEPPPGVERHDSGTEEESHDENQPTKDGNGKQDASVETSQKKTSSMAGAVASWLFALLRFILVDTSLALLFGIYVSTLLVDYVHLKYLVPQLQLMKWSEERQMSETTYYNRRCDLQDLTATTVDELVIQPNFTTQDAVNHHLTHGVSIFPDLLPDPLLDELRDFVIDRNKKEQGFWVIEPEHRFSFGVGANMDPVVATALKQIATHPTLVPFLEATIGKNPSIIEFTAITSEYGAVDQFYHADVLPYGSQTKNARSFIPSYSLFIPLQDTTAAMGATHVCPGSHVCTEEPNYCVDHGFQVSGEEDLWKKGTAFVFNQAFYHRGTAHTDPTAMARVAFILTFAPRPRYREGELETRIISQGGSYSLKWDHWGHTVDDLREADTAMTYPWTLLRSLGLYKPANKDWGWDMISVASMRITNDDNGYHDDDLESWLEERGGFYYLPRWLQGSMEGHEDSELPLWYEFLAETLYKVQAFAFTVNLAAVGFYVIMALVIDITLWFSRSPAGTNEKSKRRSVFLGSIGRLISTHGLIALVALYLIYRVDNTLWAKQILDGTLYRPQLYGSYDVTNKETHSSPGTLPTIHDVLIPSRFNSDYLGAYNDFFHVAHPGNRAWKNLIASSAVGYSTLPRMAQEKITMSIVEEVKEFSARFLIQSYGDFSRWTEIPDEFAVKRTHRELLMESGSALRAINTKIEHLLSETKFGILYDTALHRTHIPKLLTTLQENILGDGKEAKQKIGKPRKSNALGPVFKLPKLPIQTTWNAKIRAPRQILPPHEASGEPYPDAWMKEGDEVEGKYQGNFDEWYKGKIVYANSYSSEYNVLYDDGDEDAGLCRACVRAFVPYYLGEKLDARMKPDVDAFYGAKIIKIHPDGETYDVSNDSQTRRGVPQIDLRRPGTVRPQRTVRKTGKSINEGLEVGSIVEAKYQGTGEGWFRGVITRVRKDGTFDVQYDDGDYETDIEKRHIRWAPV